MNDSVLMSHRMSAADRREPPRFEPDFVPRNLLRDIVFVRLLTDILRGHYRSGQRLRLDTIAHDLRVSRTPVREALVSLEILRLVHVQRYTGVIIAEWGVENMVERVRVAEQLLAVEPEQLPGPRRLFDPVPLRDCVSEAGAFAVLTEWVLHRVGRPISADWVASQRPAIDMFYRDDIAEGNGIDMTADPHARREALITAQGAAVSDDHERCRTVLLEYADMLAQVHERFQHRPTAGREH
jgi:hypothetical protein